MRVQDGEDDLLVWTPTVSVCACAMAISLPSRADITVGLQLDTAHVTERRMGNGL